MKGSSTLDQAAPVLASSRMRRARVPLLPVLVAPCSLPPRHGGARDPHVIYTANNYADGRRHPADESGGRLARRDLAQRPTGKLFRSALRHRGRGQRQSPVADMGALCSLRIPAVRTTGASSASTRYGRQSLLAAADRWSTRPSSRGPNGDITWLTTTGPTTPAPYFESTLPPVVKTTIS